MRRRGETRLNGRARAAALGLITVAALALGAVPAAAGERGAARHLRHVRDNQTRLLAFLRAMPKGADLHTHLTGAVYAESYVRLGARNGACVDEATLTASRPPCSAGQRPVSDALSDNELYNRIIAAWSMRLFTPGPGESGHDHFFASFDKFGAAKVNDDYGALLAEVASRAAAQNEFYIEPLNTFQFGAVAKLADRAGFHGGFAATRRRMLAGGAMASIVAAARRDADAIRCGFDATLHCHTARARRACRLPIRWDYQALRANPPAVVFAQLLLGFELAQADHRFVGINLVQPEDDITALRYYRLQMRMIRFLSRLYPRAHVTLHAGELTSGLVPPKDLRFHIRAAVNVAGAQRIGHGVDIRHERNAIGLLGEMARRHVLVEINLSSNCAILRVCGRESPFGLYRRHHVPVALSTDDEGVLRTDMTWQYLRAVRTFGLGYRALKRIARAAIDHGFIEGRSIWRAPDVFRPARACAHDRLGTRHPSRRCGALLSSSPKARAEWRQERAFARFEHRYRGLRASPGRAPRRARTPSRG